MYLQDFTYHKPATLKEACELLGSKKNAAAIAGGTDILVEIKKGLRYNDNIVSLSGIKELKIIEESRGSITNWYRPSTKYGNCWGKPLHWCFML